MSRRSVVGTLRQPAMVFPSIFFPLMLAALNSAAMARSINLPGFPKVDSFLDFLLASTIIQGVLFGCTAGGNDVATDIQDGFFDRLLTTPVSRSSIVVGRLAGAATLGAIQAIFFMVVLGLFGATVKGGWPAMAAIVAIAMVLAVGLGGLAVALALRTGSAEAVQAAFPVIFISLFLSSAFFPKELMHGWFKSAATLNPMSTLIENVRHLVITGWSPAAAGKAAAIGLTLCVASVALSSAALRWRVRGAGA